MSYVSRQKIMLLKQKGDKLSLTVSGVKTVKAAIKILIDMVSQV
jgi:hypothetical protein